MDGVIGPNDRTRASRFRLRLKSGQTLLPEEAAWLADYESKLTSTAHRSKKLLHVEETAEAATGNAALELAMGAAMTREEGQRLDSILNISLTMMTRACEMMHRLAEQCLKDKLADGETHRALLESVRTHYLEKVDYEAQLREALADAEKNDGGVDGMIQQMMPAIIQEFLTRYGKQKQVKSSG